MKADELIASYTHSLASEEHAKATIEKYRRCVTQFLDWLGGRELTRALVLEYKATLRGSASTVNGAIASLNSFFAYFGAPELKLKRLRIQRRTFRSEGRELSRTEFERLVRTAERQNRNRLARAIEAIAATGIRVSELCFITLETLQKREVTITNKGKTRTVLLQKDLAAKLRRFAGQCGICSGPIFVTRSGKPLSRTQLWAEMKALCRAAGVEAAKVFPHNLRRLFAVVYYRMHRDIVKLADLLGHSSVNTTRIYLMETGKEHLRQLEAMRMVL